MPSPQPRTKEEFRAKYARARTTRGRYRVVIAAACSKLWQKCKLALIDPKNGEAVCFAGLICDLAGVPKVNTGDALYPAWVFALSPTKGVPPGPNWYRRQVGFDPFAALPKHRQKAVFGPLLHTDQGLIDLERGYLASAVGVNDAGGGEDVPLCALSKACAIGYGIDV